MAAWIQLLKLTYMYMVDLKTLYTLTVLVTLLITILADYMNDGTYDSFRVLHKLETWIFTQVVIKIADYTKVSAA